MKVRRYTKLLLKSCKKGDNVTNIHTFLRYNLVGWFFLVLFIIWMWFLNPNIIKWIIDKNVFSILASFIGGALFGFVSFNVYHWIYKFDSNSFHFEKGRAYFKEIRDLVSDITSNLTRNQIRAIHDVLLWQEEKNVSERICFLSSRAHSFGVLIMAIVFSFIFPISFILQEFFWQKLVEMLVLIFLLMVLALIFWDMRKKDLQLIDELERVFLRKRRAELRRLTRQYVQEEG